MDSPEGFLKRTALQIATQLPENDDEARRVIALVLEIIDHLGKDWSEPIQPSVDRIGQARRKAGAQVTPLFAPDRSNPT